VNSSLSSSSEAWPESVQDLFPLVCWISLTWKPKRIWTKGTDLLVGTDNGAISSYSCEDQSSNVNGKRRRVLRLSSPAVASLRYPSSPTVTFQRPLIASVESQEFCPAALAPGSCDGLNTDFRSR
jgi:hypothetical protein